MMRVVVMGVAGSGKTTVGERLATALGARYVEADSAHPPENIAKMSAGIPLTDDDRWPWLERLAGELAGGDPVVVTCSALKRRYRDVLRTAGSVQFVYLAIDRRAATERMAARRDHFMGVGMVDSQFAALEPPSPDETDVITIDGSRPVADLVASALAALGRQ
jgi:carbohydrate kinase (thermoresistant glucokinase family)